MTTTLHALSDADLVVLDAWVTPLGQLDRHPDVASWARTAFMSLADEKRRRTDGGDVTEWPTVDQLADTSVMFLGWAVAGLHDHPAVSPGLREWIEQVGNGLVDTLVDRRADPDD